MKVKIWKISQINSYIKNMIDDDVLLNSFFAEGEISNLKLHTSGHIYFTLKDTKSAINCVMFKTYSESITFDLENGMKVIVCGYISMYEKTGHFQLYVELLEPFGQGRLYASFEQLKLKLEKEGLFDSDRKKQIPIMPKCVAVITSKTGAAVQDVINVIRRRNKNIKIVIFPVLVQGNNAAMEMIRAIKNANEWGKADVIILGRGGGSLEDLGPFNDENLARSIYKSKLPIISAVGHETDFTISDFVSDLRAPTPSAAAELAVPELKAIKKHFEDLKNNVIESLNMKIHYSRETLNNLINRNVMQNPCEIIYIKRKTIIDLYKIINKEMKRKLETNTNQLCNTIKTLKNTSPLNVIARGYVIAKNEKNEIITASKDINANDKLNFQFKDGIVIAIVNEKR